MIYYVSTVENNVGRLTTEDENGNSFLLCEEEIPFPYSTVTIGNQVWTSENITFDDGESDIYIKNNYIIKGYNFGTVYFYKDSAFDRIEQQFPEYRIPTVEDVEILKNYVNNNAVGLKSVEGWYSNPGTNELGFNGQPLGCINIIGTTVVFLDDGYSSMFHTKTKIASLNTNNTITTSTSNNSYIPVRLIKR